MKKIAPKYPTLCCNENRGRDNKDYYNTSGAPCSSGYKVRVPSLKRSKKIWNNFYRLFPYIKDALMAGKHVSRFGQPTLEGNVYICKDERWHGGYDTDRPGPGYRIRTTKFLKCW